jgi:hypothetical protein
MGFGTGSDVNFLRPSPLVVTPRSFFIAEAALVTLNLLDALLTISFVTAGVATEANPLLAAALTRSPADFVALKLALLFFGIGVLHACRRVPAARTAMSATAAAYVAICAWQLFHLL